MIKPEAFIALEVSAATTVSSGWTNAAQKAEADLLDLLTRERWDEAHDYANRIAMNGMVDGHRRRLEELATSALLFGAQNASGRLSDTSFVKGDQALPWAMNQALDQLMLIVEQGGAERVRTSIHDLIRAEETRPVQKAEGMTLAQRLNAAVMGTGKSVIDIGANLTTSRLVSLGFLSEATVLKHDVYQVSEVLDDRTCPVCEYTHGKTFSVTQEHSRLLSVLGTMDPQELKSVAPWPKQTKAGIAELRRMSASDMQAAGYGSPPYHPGCRGMLVQAGTVEEIVPVRVPTLTAAAVPTSRSTRRAVNNLADDVTAVLTVDVVAEATLRKRIAAIADFELMQDALAAYVAGDLKQVERILDQAGVTSRDKV